MAKFHITNEGEVKPCHAKQGNCPYGGAENHFNTPAEAQAEINRRMKRDQSNEFRLNSMVDNNISMVSASELNNYVPKEVSDKLLNVDEDLVQTDLSTEDIVNLPHAEDIYIGNPDDDTDGVVYGNKKFSFRTGIAPLGERFGRGILGTHNDDRLMKHRMTEENMIDLRSEYLSRGYSEDTVDKEVMKDYIRGLGFNTHNENQMDTLAENISKHTNYYGLEPTVYVENEDDYGFDKNTSIDYDLDKKIDEGYDEIITDVGNHNGHSNEIIAYEVTQSLREQDYPEELIDERDIADRIQRGEKLSIFNNGSSESKYIDMDSFRESAAIEVLSDSTRRKRVISEYADAHTVRYKDGKLVGGQINKDTIYIQNEFTDGDGKRKRVTLVYSEQ